VDKAVPDATLRRTADRRHHKQSREDDRSPDVGEAGLGESGGILDLSSATLSSSQTQTKTIFAVLARSA
jgi:hypothetical protein